MPVKKTSKKAVAKKVISKPAVKTVKKTVVAPKVMPKMVMPKVQTMPIKKLDSKKLIKPLIFLLILATVYLLKDEVIVASVNGKPVTRWALTRNLEKQSASTVLENMTLQMLVEQELKKAGIEVTDEEMDAEISKIEEQLAAQGQNLDDLLAAQNLTRTTVREQLALSKGMEKLLAGNIIVTDEEITAYFEQNKEMMGADVALEDIKADIEAQLKQEKLATEQQKWFAEIKKNAKINYFKFAPSVSL